MESKLELCNEKKNQISMIVHNGALTSINSNSRACKFSKTISLLQEPKENVTLEFALSYSRRVEYRNYTNKEYYNFQYVFILTFENNLHEVSKDYGYEIDFYTYAHENEASSHALLFSSKRIRETNKISISENYNDCEYKPHPVFINELVKNVDKRHMCCSIRRFNIKVSEDVDLQSIPNTNVGAMLFEKGLYSDVTLIVGEEEEHFRAHKDILSAASDVFKVMFSHDMIENQKDEVIIDDFNPEIIEGLLSFIYTGKAGLLSELPREFFQAAHRYEIHSLKAKCIEYFIFNLDTTNVVDVLFTASTFELIDLKTDLMRFIEIHEEEMVKEESFQTFLRVDLKIETVVYTLKLCDKYKDLLSNVKTAAFKFIKENTKILVDNTEFLKLFKTHSSLMRKLFVFIHKND